MMTHRVSLSLFALVLTAFMAVTPAFAQRGGRGGGMGRGEMGGGMGPGGMGPHEMRMEMGQCMIDELDLTEAQVAQIKAIRERYRDADKDRVKAMRELRKDMREARRGGDQAEFERLRTQMQQAAEQLRASREQMHTEVMNVLTAEQRAKFDAAREKCHEQGKKGRKGGRHGKGHCDGEGDGGQRMRGPANTGERQNPNID